jgi:predicted AAA+ superfamily ATPase
MTEQDILLLQAGNKLDALVAEHLMGFSGRHTVYYWRDRKKKESPFIIFACAPEGFFSDTAHSFEKTAKRSDVANLSFAKTSSAFSL